MANDDFFLNFGSNADPFASKLASELAPGIAQITALTRAILEYDEAVGSMSSSNPLGSMFTQLDAASSKLDAIGTDLGTAFRTITDSLGILTRDLQSALATVERAGAAARVTTATASKQTNAQGFTPEQQRIIDAQRRGVQTAAARVTDDELTPAKQKQTQSTIAKATSDGDAARNAVKRVADINATLARNATDAADGIQRLGQAIRTLTTQTKASTGGITEGRFQQNTVVVGGGGAGQLGNIPPQAIQAILAQAGIQEAQQAPARDAAHQAQRDAADSKRQAEQLTRAQFTDPARPGRYQVPDEKAPRTVSSRINPGETFGDYFTRAAGNSQGLETIRQTVRESSEQRVGIQQSQELQRVQQLIGRKGLETLSGPEHAALIEGRTPGSIPTETIRASVGSVLSPGQSLTPRQYEQVPAALAEYQKMQEQFASLARQDVTGRIAANPAETFAFAPEGNRRQDVFGQTRDYRSQIAGYDIANPDTEGAAYRASVEERVGESRANRSARIGASRDLDGPREDYTYRNQQPVIGQGRSAGKPEADTLAQYDAEVAQLIAEARAANQDGEKAAQTLQEAATELKSEAGGGGRPPRPPRPPRTGSSESEQPGEEEGAARTPRVRPGGTAFPITQTIKEFEAGLQEGTRSIIAGAREAIPNLTGIQKQNEVERAGQALARDPAFGQLGGLSQQRQTLGTLLQLPRSGATNQSLAAVFGRGSSGTGYLGGGTSIPASQAKETIEAAAAEQRLAAAIAETTGRTAAMTDAILARFAAEEKLNIANSAETRNPIAIANATRGVISANQNIDRVTAQETPKTTNQRLFGQAGFQENQLRHIGLGLENQIGYNLVFTGFEKLKELVHDGLEAQAAFARLQASLDANGISADGLRQKLQNISASTATPLEQVTEAASELSGTLKNASDLEFGTNVASQLANISQGALTAKEAAVGLRDVIAAYGDQWANTGVSVQQGIQQTGDDIAKLSQLTGVNVKDITEGTTQIASEARDFNLNQRQASTIAAYVTQGTGETGEQAASQTSRLLSTLNNTKTQEALQRVLTPPSGTTIQQQFAGGDIGDVLTELIGQYGSLNDSSKQYIANLMGTGIQARAFAALVGGGSNAVKALNGDFADFGALAAQNKSYLQTIAGQIKQLDEDFQNFGSTLQRIGAFDALGGLVKVFDDLLKVVNNVGGALANVAGDVSGGTSLLHITTTVLELAAAWKLVGSSATGALARTSLGGRLIGGAPIANQAAREEAAAVEGAAIPRARYRARDVAGQFGRNLTGSAEGRRAGFRAGEVDDATAPEKTERNTVRTAEQRAIQTTTTELGALTEGLQAATTALGGLATATDTTSVSEGEATVATQSLVAAEAEAAALGFLPGMGALRGAPVQGVLPFGESAAASESAVAAEQGTLPLVFRNPATGRFATPEAAGAAEAQRAESAAAARAAAEQESMLPILATPGASGQKFVPLGAGAGAAEGELAAAAAASRLGFVGKNLSQIPGLGRVLGLANAGGATGAVAGAGGLLPAAALGYVGLQYLHGADQEEDKRGAAADRLLKGGTNAGDISRLETPRSFLDYNANTGAFGNNIPVLHTLGQAGNMLQHALGFNSAGSNGNPSDASNDAYFKLFDQVTGGFAAGSEGAKNSAGSRTIKGTLPKLTSVQAVQDFEKETQAEIEKERDQIQKAGGNDKQAQAQIAANINQLEANLQTAAQHRLAAIKGLAAIDVLNSQQITDLQSAAGTISSLSFSTLASQGEAVKNLLEGGTLSPGSSAYKDLLAASQTTGTPAKIGTAAGVTVTDGGQDLRATPGRAEVASRAATAAPTSQARALALSKAYEQSIKNANSILESIGTPNAASQASFDAASQQLQTGLTGYQQAQQSYYQTPIQTAQGQASLALSVGGTGAGGGFGGAQFQTGNAAAITDLKKANSGLATYANTLDKTSPEYYQTLAQIETNKQQIAQIQYQPQVTQLAVQAASTSDQVSKANIALQAAYAQMAQDKSGGASSQQIGADQAAIAGSQLGVQQADQAVTSAQFQLQIAQTRNSVRKSQDTLNQALQAENVYRRGGLADQASLLQAEAQEAQARQSIADAIEAQKEGAIEATSALQKYHGDAVGSAESELLKAQDAYKYAVQQYGKNSAEADSAFVGVLTAQAGVNDAVTAQITAGLDLEIAQLNARGKQGDAQAAANAELQKARVALSRYEAAGGQKGTAQYDALYGAIATAQRNAFDVALNAQLDTLDFQKETYQITGAQEIAALQQILKNKELTLAEQRSITLKIKGLQDDIRTQLTQGGLNIPSDIKLPTAYDVRRSLGAGFTGTQTHASVVNNNQQASVTINQMLPTSAVANAVANQVIAILNQQTGQQVRANSATPRLVNTG